MRRLLICLLLLLTFTLPACAATMGDVVAELRTACEAAPYDLQNIVDLLREAVQTPTAEPTAAPALQAHLGAPGFSLTISDGIYYNMSYDMHVTGGVPPYICTYTLYRNASIIFTTTGDENGISVTGAGLAYDGIYYASAQVTDAAGQSITVWSEGYFQRQGGSTIVSSIEDIADLYEWINVPAQSSEQTPVPTATPASAPTITHLTDATFDSFIASADMPVLVDLWASWCNPCLELAPYVEAFAAAHPEVLVAKVEVDKNWGVAGRFTGENGQLSIPTLLLFQDGQLVNLANGLYMPADLFLEDFVNGVVFD